MNFIIAAGVGSFVTLMATFNSQLALHSGQLFSLLVFHLCGFAFIRIIRTLSRKEKMVENAPFYLYLGGVVGVLVVYLNNLCFIKLGASVTISMIMMGQTIGSVLTDATGFLNMTKHRFRKKKLIGLSLMAIGILTMVDQWQMDYLYIFLSLLTGFLVLLSILLNSQLGLKLGVLRATQTNYLAGLCTIVGIIVLTDVQLTGLLDNIFDIHPAFLFGGGICGVLVVIGFNTVVPKIPAVYTTVLMFLGQILAGLSIDFYIHNTLSIRLVVGCVIVFGGLLANISFDRTVSSKNQQIKTVESANSLG